MADNTKLQYIIDLITQGDTTKAAAELKKLDAQAGSTGAGIAALGGHWGKLIALIGGTAVLHQSIEAFLEQERAVAKLNATLKATGEFTPEVSKQFQELSEAMAETSRFADEEILNVIAKLKAAGAASKDIERLTRAVLDLSTLMDRDLNRATQAFAMALQGDVGALRQVGIAIDETKTATEQFNDVLAQIGRKAGGQSAEGVKTLGGQYEQLTKRVNEAKEALGAFVLAAGFNIKDFFGGATQKKVDEEFAKISGQGPAGPPVFLLSSQVPGAKNPIGAPVQTEGLTKADEEKQKEKAKKDLEDRQKAEVELGRLQNQNYDDFRRGEKMKQDLANQAALASLDGIKREREELKINHEDRLRQISEVTFATGQQYDEALAAEKKLYDAEVKRFEEAHSLSAGFQKDLRQFGEESMQLFSGGLATAIVSAFEEGDKAFQKFAANFFKQIAEMILQMLIFNALKAGAKALFGGGGQADSSADPSEFFAGGGVRFAATGLMSVSSPTYLPKFNVLAGEAGREVLTVLARPRFERINGVPAMIGRAGNQNLAITSQSALAGGGNVNITVTLTQGLKAEIVENSIAGAKVAIVQDMGDNTPVSRAVRKLTQ